MSDYIFFDSAIRMFVDAYLISMVLLLSASIVGLAMLETLEKTDSKSLGTRG